MTSKKNPLTKQEMMDIAWQSVLKGPNREEHVLHMVAVKKDAGALLAELGRAGFKLEAIEDLYHKGYNYKVAIPILLTWLPKLSHPANKEMIITALRDKSARLYPDIGALLIEEFKRSDPSQEKLRDDIGFTLENVANDSIVHDMLEIAKDKKYGKTRRTVVMSLCKLKDSRVPTVLISLLDDMDVAISAIYALGKLKEKKALSKIEGFLKNSDSNLRSAAKKAIQKIVK